MRHPAQRGLHPSIAVPLKVLRSETSGHESSRTEMILSANPCGSHRVNINHSWQLSIWD